MAERAKLYWQVALARHDEGMPTMIGYGATSEAALRDLLSRIDARATSAQDEAARVTAAMVKVRGEIEALGG